MIKWLAQLIAKMFAPPEIAPPANRKERRMRASVARRVSKHGSIWQE